MKVEKPTRWARRQLTVRGSNPQSARRGQARLVVASADRSAVFVTVRRRFPRPRPSPRALVPSPSAPTLSSSRARPPRAPLAVSPCRAPPPRARPRARARTTTPRSASPRDARGARARAGSRADRRARGGRVPRRPERELARRGVASPRRRRPGAPRVVVPRVRGARVRAQGARAPPGRPRRRALAPTSRATSPPSIPTIPTPRWPRHAARRRRAGPPRGAARRAHATDSARDREARDAPASTTTTTTSTTTGHPRSFPPTTKKIPADSGENSIAAGVIQGVLATHPGECRYYQGLHDVAAVLLLACGDAAAAVLDRLVAGHLRDNVRGRRLTRGVANGSPPAAHPRRGPGAPRRHISRQHPRQNTPAAAAEEKPRDEDEGPSVSI